ncbi:MAG: zinc carboxypeptidase [Lewinellaceae bacterium]|nr:zinc carboxypeptidase [Lewinellaceae bacterium]
MVENTVVIVDPSLNPDGYDRYTHWNRMVSNTIKNPKVASREHREPWPGGRTNHYYFDLNRDWAWATQAETQQRLAVYQNWLPQIHADLHEQYYDNPYYFAPAAEPMHDYITPWQRDFQTAIGRNHATYFDAKGWLYFTKEVFDLFYPSYGDTYPMFNGAIGMTYEQAGHSSAGRAVLKGTGDTLSLYDRIEHHLTTSLSTIEMASKNASRVVENFRKYYYQSANKPQGAYQAFVVSAENDPNRVNALCKLLDQHRIRYGRAGTTSSLSKAYDYISGAETTLSLQPNDLVISAFQPHGVLVQVLFEPAANLSDSLTYDITAWALPYAYGLRSYALKSRLEPQKDFVAFKAPEVMLAAKPYAWCVHRNSLAEACFLGEIQGKGLNVRYATRSFDMADQHFEPGTLVITRADNQKSDDALDGIVKMAAGRHNVGLHPIFSGFMSKGNDMGSDAFVLMKRPEVAIVYGDDVDDNSFGHTWFFFEQELHYPVTIISVEQLARMRLDDFNTLIFPNGNYNLSDVTNAQLLEWMRNGGKLIAFENAVKAFADKDGFDLKSKSAVKPDSAGQTPMLYREKERDQLSDQLPGAIVKARVDPGVPAAYGLGDWYFSLKTTGNTFEMPESGTNAIWLDKGFSHVGFIGSRLTPRLEKSPIVSIERKGRGAVVYMVDNPLFRDFWYQGKVLFFECTF